MIIAVFGASGRTGRLVVDEALAKGHQVRAYVRDAGRLPAGRPGLTVFEGEIDDEATVRAVLKGSDAVISALGAGGGTLTRFAATLLPAMRESGVSRLVSLVGSGVTEPFDKGSLGRTIMLGLMRVLARDMLADATAHAEQVRGSGLRWTLVRPPRLTDGPRTGTISSGAEQSLGPRDTISRADLAVFMVAAAVGDSFVGQSPLVAAHR